MEKILTEFNSLLKRTHTAAIVEIDDRYEWIIEPKENVSDFIQAIENAINNRYDGTCKLKKAQDFDSGYSLEITVDVEDSFNDTFFTTIYLYLATKF